jgi:hypothetical protein
MSSPFLFFCPTFSCRILLAHLLGFYLHSPQIVRYLMLDAKALKKNIFHFQFVICHLSLKKNSLSQTSSNDKLQIKNGK